MKSGITLGSVEESSQCGERRKWGLPGKEMWRAGKSWPSWRASDVLALGLPSAMVSLQLLCPRWHLNVDTFHVVAQCLWLALPEFFWFSFLPSENLLVYRIQCQSWTQIAFPSFFRKCQSKEHELCTSWSLFKLKTNVQLSVLWCFIVDKVFFQPLYHLFRVLTLWSRQPRYFEENEGNNTYLPHKIERIKWGDICEEPCIAPSIQYTHF